MNIKFLKGNEQSDYENGCIEISTSDQIQAFELGRLFSKLINNKFKTVSLDCNETVAIRIPLTMELK